MKLPRLTTMRLAANLSLALLAGPVACGNQEQAAQIQSSEMVSLEVKSNFPDLETWHPVYQILSRDKLHQIAEQALAERLREAGLSISYFEDERFGFRLSFSNLEKCTRYAHAAECYEAPQFRIYLSLTEDGEAVETVHTDSRLPSFEQFEVRQHLVNALDRLIEQMVGNGALDHIRPRPETP